MMKKLLIAIAMLVGLTVNAYAIDVNFEMVGLWDWGTVYNFTSGSPATWTPDTDTDGAGPDVDLGINPYYGTHSQVLTNGSAALPDSTEDSYGVMKVNKITAGPSTLFNTATDPYELTAFFYGFDDVYINGDPSISRLLSVGGHAALYADPAKNYNDVSPLGPQSTAFGGGRDQFDPTKFLTVTDGDLVLDLTPRAIVDPATGVTRTLGNLFSFSSLSGFGDILFDVTGGTWASQYDTNTQDFGADFKLNFASFPNTDGLSAWTVRGTGNARGNVVPEPASMILMGIGLAGAARLRRRTA